MELFNELRMTQAKHLNMRIPLAGKKLLEIGCGDGFLLKHIADCYEVESIIGIDPFLLEWYGIGGDNWSIRDGNVEQLCFEDNIFDTVISYSTFEHIGDIVKALSEIKRVLKPYGKFYTEFAPIWTSITGHHFTAQGDWTWNPEHLKLIPPWGHLYMDRTEMKEHLMREKVEPVLEAQILHYIYESEIINRLSRVDLTDAIFGSGMIIRFYREFVKFDRLSFTAPDKRENELTEDIINRIKESGYMLEDIGVSGIAFCLEKYDKL